MTARVDELVAALTLDEKTSLTGGADMWSTPAIARLGIPSINVTDGPNGARGRSLFELGGETAACVPCGSALGATWDPALVERVGVMLGEEARTKACRALLAPTVNTPRSPIGGRNFECYAEDPLLSGRIAAGFVRGVQSQGVATTVKHFAGNDAEFERSRMNSVIGTRELREIILVPFELAVTEGGTLGIMTGYNRLNGPHCSEHVELLDGILRGEWGFEGFVVTDWYSAGSSDGSAAAGVDLEMPGPARWFGPALAAAVRDGSVDETLVDAQVRRLLGVYERLGALDDTGTAETTVDRADHRALAREAAVASMALLKNDDVLPFAVDTIGTLAVIGPNAQQVQLMGGGSASLAPHYRVSPLEALRDRLGASTRIVAERGCDINRATRVLGGPGLTTPDGAPGIAIDLFANAELDGDPVSRHSEDGDVLILGDLGGANAAPMSMRLHGRFVAEESGRHTFTFAQLGGQARATIDGELVFDGVTDPPPPGNEHYGMASREREVPMDLAPGQTVDISAEYTATTPGIFRGVRIGCRLPEIPDGIERAAQAAAHADAVIVVVGNSPEWESEGRDRTSMDLPGEQDELVRRVVAANPNTVVVVNTGAPVTMEWADDAPAILQAWFGGQEMANALVDVLTGDAEPGGRLSITIPQRLEHSPAFGSFPGENGEQHYGEGLLVGYRWYDARHLPVRFPFGHGLSYTTCVIGEPTAPTQFVRGAPFVIDVPVENTGDRAGVEVVQCYVEPLAPRLFRPTRELKAFAKVALEPGDHATVQLTLDDRSFAYWDQGDASWSTENGEAVLHRDPIGWRVDAGAYRLHIGRSSVDFAHVLDVRIDD